LHYRRENFEVYWREERPFLLGELALNIHLRHKRLPGYADFEKCVTIGFVLIDPGTRPLMPVLKTFLLHHRGLEQMRQ
jgi:hypothetical protein